MSEAGAILQEVVLPEGARSVASGLRRASLSPGSLAGTAALIEGAALV